MIKKYLVIGICILFIGLAVSPSIYADGDRVYSETIEESVIFDYDGYTPIQLVFLLINKVRFHKDFQNVESEEDVMLIIEEDSELNSIVEKLESFDCGCEDEEYPVWRFWGICIFLLPFVNIGLRIYVVTGDNSILNFFGYIGLGFNCWWAEPP
jgi:hypothetical protein